MAKFTDAHLVEIAVRLIEHARNTTAIKDCRCHECSGFLEESAQWLEIVRSRADLETKSVHLPECAMNNEMPGLCDCSAANR